MVKLAKAAKKQATPKKKAPPPPKEVDEESGEEESEEEAPPPKAVKAKGKPTPVKAAKNGKAAKKAESEEDESAEESEEEAPPPKKTPAKQTPAKKTPIKAAPAKEESEEEEDEEDESEEEVPPPKKATPAKPAVKVTPAKEESEDDEEEEDEESEEEMDTAPPAPKAKKAGMVKAKEESEEDDDEEEEDDDDDEEEEDDDEEEDDAPVTPAKRKAGGKKETPPAKKAKSDGEGAFCMYVGNLNGESKDFDELKEALGEFFTKKNLDVQEVRLGATRKFGYVEFATEEDLLKGMELNGKKFLGQELKLDRARSKESSQEGKKERDNRTLFVKNLPFSATADDLRAVFENAVDIRLPPGQSGSNRGIAYVEFKTEAIADKMIEEAQGADVQGRSIIVDYTGDKSQKGSRPAASSPGAASKTLVVNNLAYSASEDTLQSLFEKAVAIRVPQSNGRPKGFAFVEFESADEAKEAMDSKNGSEIEGRTIRLEYSQNSGGKPDGGRGSSGPTKTLFVRGLSEDTTDGTLKESFDGAVAARIVTDRDSGSSKGFGFVDFDNEADCKAAKEAMEGGEIDGRQVQLDYAKPKGEGGFRGGRGGGGFGGGGFGGRGGGGRGGRGGFGGRGGGGGGFRGRGGNRGGGRGFGGGRGGGGFGGKPRGNKTKFDE